MEKSEKDQLMLEAMAMFAASTRLLARNLIVQKEDLQQYSVTDLCEMELVHFNHFVNDLVSLLNYIYKDKLFDSHARQLKPEVASGCDEIIMRIFEDGLSLDSYLLVLKEYALEVLSVLHVAVADELHLELQNEISLEIMLNQSGVITGLSEAESGVDGDVISEEARLLMASIFMFKRVRYAQPSDYYVALHKYTQESSA